MEARLNHAATTLQGASSMLCTTHRRPDADGVGSMLALLHVFGETANVRPVLQQDIPDSLQFLPGSEQIQTQEHINPVGHDRIVVLDCGTWERTGLRTTKALATAPILFIDHHNDEREEWLTNAEYHTATMHEAESTTMMLYDVFKHAAIPITRDIATCLLAGLVADTGGFVHQNTSARVLEVAADLLKKGAALRTISKNLLQQKSASLLRLWGRAVATMKIQPTGLAYAVVTKEDIYQCGASGDDISGIANIMSYSKDVACALVLTQITEQRIKVSLRAEADRDVNVEEIAQRFGGGGHPLAAGFEMEGRIVEEDGDWKII